MWGKAHTVGDGKIDRDFADGLGCIHMKVTVREVPDQRGGLGERLQGAEFAVDCGERHEAGILPEERRERVQIDATARQNGKQINLIADFLQIAESCADGGMLERGADDVAADMAAGCRAAEQCEIVGFCGAGGKNQFFR